MAQSNNPTATDIGGGDKRNGRPKTKERSAPQVAIQRFGLTNPELAYNYPRDTTTGKSWFVKVREMATDPTLSLVRDLVLGPILASEWSVGHTDKAPKGAVELVAKNINNIRSYLVEHTLLGWMDFGWQCFEKVWAIDKDGNAVVDKVKPLLQDITRILVDTGTGEYIGIMQLHQFDQKLDFVMIGNDFVSGSGYLKAKDTILSNINVEGTYWYGRAIMNNAIKPYDSWLDVEQGANNYDRKIAGSHWVIYFPLGETEFEGVLLDNFDIAQKLIQNLEQSGAIGIPVDVAKYVEQVNKDAPLGWKVELLSDSTNQQANFLDRLKYLDTLKVRALGFPERAVMEGKFGTKAEAEVHSDAAVTIAEYRHQRLTEHISYQLVNDLMRFNYGRESIGSVFLKPAPIADDHKLFLRTVFTTLMQHDVEAALKDVNSNMVLEELGLRRNAKGGDSSKFKFTEKVEKTEKPEPQKPNGLNPVEGQNTKKTV